MWFDQMAIPVDAPNPEGAHAFLNFILDAQNMVAASNYVYYANGNKASQEFLAEDVIGDLPGCGGDGQHLHHYPLPGQNPARRDAPVDQDQIGHLT